MSLLMEALRKAEEAKKKAEQESGSAETPNKPSDLAPPASPASQETAAFDYPRLNDNKSASIDDTESEEGEAEAARSLDVPIEFEGDAVDVAAAEPNSELELEPQRYTAAELEPEIEHDATAGQPSLSPDEGDSSYAADDPDRDQEEPSELGPDAADEAGEDSPETAPAAMDLGPLDDSIARAANALDPGFNATSAPVSPEPSPAQSDSSFQADSPGIEPRSDYALQSEQQQDAVAGTVGEPSVSKGPATEEAPSIKERSSAHQRSARSLFAIKRGQKPNKIVLLAGTAVLVLLLGGGSLLLLNGSGGSGIAAPPVGYSPSALQENGGSNADVIEGEVEGEVQVAAPTADPSPVDVAAGQQSSAAAFTPTAEALEFDALDQAQDATGAADVESMAIADAAADDSADDSIGSEPAAVIETPQVEPAATLSATAGPSTADVQTTPADTAPLAFTDDPDAGNAVGLSGSISFTRADQRDRLQAELNQAYAAFNGGDYGAARNLYQQALVNAPRNKDVLLGLAALDVREGNRNGALELYSRVLSLDPSDAVARAGVLTTMPGGSVAEQERAFRRLLDQQQELATLHFAFANFLANQGRWTDAQQSYFTALRIAKSRSGAGAVNPDYAFNLAISLERINQPALARDYYAEALAMANSTPASFDPTVARSRMNALSAGTADE